MVDLEARHKYREVIRVSLPLVASTMTTLVMQFTDRVFLANYSLDAIAAALPAGVVFYMFVYFFIGTAGYVNVFIAQYTGSGALHRVGPALWQGIYFSILAGLAMVALYFCAGPIFRFGGHSPEVQELEVIYFRALCLGSGVLILGTGLSCFFSGRGLTRPVMIINLVGAVINIPLDYALINGIGVFPELGIMGAGLATAMAWLVIAICYVLIVFTRENDRIYNIWKNRLFESELFGRLMRFGVPGALQFCMDIFAFTFFIFMVGRIGKFELAVTSIVLSIESLSFQPLMGFSLGTSTLVGQALGRGQPEEAVSIAKATTHIACLYILALMLIFVCLPQPLIKLFRPDDMPLENLPHMIHLGSILLRFVACYVLFDAFYMIIIGVLKGAGDTRFIMWSMGILSIFGMLLPVYIGVAYFGGGIYFIWSWATFYVFLLAAVSFWRYRQGTWKKMRVIEQQSHESVVSSQ